MTTLIELKNIEAARAANPGLYLAGNYVGGVSVDDCLARGLSVARSLRGGAA